MVVVGAVFAGTSRLGADALTLPVATLAALCELVDALAPLGTVTEAYSVGVRVRVTVGVGVGVRVAAKRRELFVGAGLLPPGTGLDPVKLSLTSRPPKTYKCSLKELPIIALPPHSLAPGRLRGFKHFGH